MNIWDFFGLPGIPRNRKSREDPGFQFLRFISTQFKIPGIWIFREMGYPSICCLVRSSVISHTIFVSLVKLLWVPLVGIWWERFLKGDGTQLFPPPENPRGEITFWISDANQNQTKYHYRSVYNCTSLNLGRLMPIFPSKKPSKDILEGFY